MKNFFKKLSFVLAIAMVLTSIAPATASAAEVVPAKKVNVKNLDGEKITSVELDVEETETVKLGLVVKKAYEGQKSTFKTWAVSADEDVVEVTKIGNRKYDLTGVAAGETTITIRAAKTLKLAQAGKGVKAELNVVVNEKAAELTAVQSGANKITVTGTDLSEKASDYTLKLGTATKALATAKKQEDGSVVLTASASYFVDGAYTLKFGETTVELPLESSETHAIVVYPENAIMATTQSAVVYFKAVNKWDEDVTAKAQLSAVGTNIDASLINKGILKFNLSGTEQYQLNLSQIAVNIMDKDNGTNYANILTVSDYSKLKEVTVKGIYEVVGGVAKPATLKEDAQSSDLANIKILLSGVDQYGLPFDAAQITNVGTNANINLYTTGLTGLKVGNITQAPVVLDGIKYACVDLDVETSFGKLKAGEATVQGYVLTGTGTALKETFTVGGKVKIASLTINATDVIYGNDTVELSYEALDEDGNSITDIETLCKFNDQTRNAGALKSAGLYFVGSKDGKAKLLFDAPQASSQTIVSISWISDTNVYGYKTLNIMPDRKAVSVIGVWSTAERSAAQGGAYIAATSGNAISVTVRQLKYEDQYGNTIPYGDFNKCVSGSGIKIKLTTDMGNVPAVFGTVTTNAAIGTLVTVSSASASYSVVSCTSQAINASGSAIATVGLESEAPVNGSTRKSTCEFKIAAVAMKDATVSAMFYNPNVYVTAPAISTIFDTAVSSYGAAASVNYGAFDVNATAGVDYITQYQKTPVLNPIEVGQNATAESAATVWVDDEKGTVLSIPYTATNATTKIVNATVYSPYGADSSYYYPGFYTTGAGVTVDVRRFLDVTKSAFDTTTPGLGAGDARVTFTNIPEGAHVVNNGSVNARVSFDGVAGYDKYYTITATYAWDNGYSNTEVLCFKINKTTP